jgi:hypothetical protein
MVQIAAALIILYFGFPLIVTIFSGIFEAFITFVVFAFKAISSCISFFQGLFNSSPPEVQVEKRESSTNSVKIDADDLSQINKSEIEANEKNSINLTTDELRLGASPTQGIKNVSNAGVINRVFPENYADDNWRVIGTIRHNTNCRYFKSKHAISCSSNSGVACKLCGG